MSAGELSLVIRLPALDLPTDQYVQVWDRDERAARFFTKYRHVY
jgi:hypothetical protein